MRTALIAALLLAPLAAPAVAAPKMTVAKAVADPRRPEADRARDKYRHPVETLAFFDVRPGMTVVELFPSGGWYTRILAPLENGTGTYVGATGTGQKGIDSFNKLVADNADWFGKGVVQVAFDPKGTTLWEGGTADRVLTFRNIHNLLMQGNGAAENAFTAFFKALKPGGILGVVEHRLPEEMDTARELKTGYVKRSTIIRLAEGAGFKLAGESKVNANPKDTHDWPEGVWTLPPTYRLGDVDKAKYAAIGESDRLTLKFVKPAK